MPAAEPLISLVVPCFNEEAVVRETCAQLTACHA